MSVSQGTSLLLVLMWIIWPAVPENDTATRLFAEAEGIVTATAGPSTVAETLMRDEPRALVSIPDGHAGLLVGLTGQTSDPIKA